MTLKQVTVVVTYEDDPTMADFEYEVVCALHDLAVEWGNVLDVSRA